MGASDSFPLPRYSCCIHPENPDSFLVDHHNTSVGKLSSRQSGVCRSGWSSRHRHRRNVSATFSFTDSTDLTFTAGTTQPVPLPTYNDVINVNTATEEELMTLSGVTRQVARNIVDYRRRIGGFRKVEDVALVSGIGASRLAMIRSELSVGPRLTHKSRDDGSSMSSSGIGDDLIPAAVDINTASVVELAQVPLLSTPLAERIIEHRTQNGPFTDVDELLCISGVTVSVLAAIKQYLTVGGDTLTVGAGVDSEQLQLFSDFMSDFKQLFGNISRTQLKRQRTVNPLPSVSSGIRLASWNLDQCNSLKINNPGVKEVITMTILENRLSLVAFQGLTDKYVLQKVCSELNEPTLTSVRSYSGPRGRWRYSVAADIYNNFIGIIYNVDEGIAVQTTELSNLFLPVNITQVTMRSVDVQFVLVNMFIPDSLTTNNIDSLLLRLTSELYNFDETKIVFVGNLQSAPDLMRLVGSSVTPVIPVVDINSAPVVVADNNCCENIWLNQSLCSHSYTGKSGVITDGLTSPWIPNGWQFGGAASKFNPLWVDLTHNS